ncbi:MAG: hypothetical protein EHM64_01925 [Ignavibacteriae bacterium]|nr:MAG: hypothetical protein EHM64_01925 [Ignavibacteriota bacterium]
MKRIRIIFHKTKKYFIKYPAVLSGIFIYSYLAICIVEYLIKIKTLGNNSYSVGEKIFESFDAFPFMWLLSVALVKVIDIRTKLHESEHQRLVAEREMHVKETQLKTVHEVTRGIQHHINNPLSIIMLTLGSAHKSASGNIKLTRQLDTLDEEVNRIIAALSDFSKLSEYNVETVDPNVGEIPLRSSVR